MAGSGSRIIGKRPSSPEQLWRRIGLILLIAGFAAACRPAAIEETPTPPPTPNTPEPTVVIPNAVPTPTRAPEQTNTPPPRPTPAPTSIIPANWQDVGGASTGVSLSIPPEWLDVSTRLATADAANPLGLVLLLLTDSERSGSGLLAGKSLTDGAFVMGLRVTQSFASDDPAVALQQLVDSLAANNRLRSSLTAVPDLNAAVVDMSGDPAHFLANGDDWITRLLLILQPPNGSSLPGGSLLFLFSAPAGQWANFAPLFDQMMAGVAPQQSGTAVAISGGAAQVSGELSADAMVGGNLAENGREVWLFTAAANQFVTLNISPNAPTLDLTLTIIGPDGRALAQVDNGFAGVDERLVDFPLAQGGRYLIEVAEYFGQAGRYDLTLQISDEPTLAETGQIQFGQSLWGQLPPNTRHYWTFAGAAGQPISIVLEPAQERMDVILDLYSPDGERIVALDEGFSGDAEVISGFALPISGVYTIRVWVFDHNGGPYTLSLDEGEEVTLNFYDAGDLAYGETRQETLQPGEVHAWFFDGRRLDQITLSVTPLDASLDLDVWLLDPAIIRIAAADNFTAGETEVLTADLTQDGQFVALVREFEGVAGDYQIELTAVPAAAPIEAGRLRYGDEMSGSLPEGKTAVWRFFGNVDDVIDIFLTPDGEADLIFWLINPQGIRVLEWDQSQAGEAETIGGVTLTADGFWGIVVKEFYGAASDYALLARRTPRQ